MSPHLVRYLQADLKEKGFTRLDKIPQSVWPILIQESYNRAIGKDGYVRSGKIIQKIETIADEIIAIFSGEENVDPRIKGILVFNHMTENNKPKE